MRSRIATPGGTVTIAAAPSGVTLTLTQQAGNPYCITFLMEPDEAALTGEELVRAAIYMRRERDAAQRGQA